MPQFTKQKTKVHVHLTNSEHSSAHGGQVLIDALCRRFGIDLSERAKHGAMIDTGFLPFAAPTARTAPGFPICRAIWP